MFPPFVASFGDQVIAVFVNLIGTVLGGLLNAISASVAANLVAPFLQSLAAALGLPTT